MSLPASVAVLLNLSSLILITLIPLSPTVTGVCFRWQVVALAGWMCATVICLSVLYGLYDTEAHGVKVLSRDVSALYNATSRTAWGVGLGWLVFACCTGYGGKHLHALPGGLGLVTIWR